MRARRRTAALPYRSLVDIHSFRVAAAAEARLLCSALLCQSAVRTASSSGDADGLAEAHRSGQAGARARARGCVSKWMGQSERTRELVHQLLKGRKWPKKHAKIDQIRCSLVSASPPLVPGPGPAPSEHPRHGFSWPNCGNESEPTSAVPVPVPVDSRRPGGIRILASAMNGDRLVVCFQTQSGQPQAQHHHWREGNLPQGSKCIVCRKSCWSTECLAGMRCQWCQRTVNSLDYF